MSRSSNTVALRLAGVDLHVKRYRYSRRQAFRGCLRNTFLGPSRVRAEFEMARRLRGRLGDVTPAAAAFGEERRAGFLRRAFFATETIADAAPVGSEASAHALGSFLRRLHAAGFSHGRLYARNLLATPDGTLRIVDLDRTTFRLRPVRGPRAARDLAHLLVSIEGLDGAALLDAYGAPSLATEVERARVAATAGLARRSGPPHVTT